MSLVLAIPLFQQVSLVMDTPFRLLLGRRHRDAVGFALCDAIMRGRRVARAESRQLREAWQMQPWALTQRRLCDQQTATHHQLEHKAEYMTMRPCSTIFRLVDWATGGLAFHVKLSNVDTSRWGPSASVAAQHHLVRQAVVSSKHRLHT